MMNLNEDNKVKTIMRTIKTILGQSNKHDYVMTFIMTIDMGTGENN